jgi:hypothetical protein
MIRSAELVALLLLAPQSRLPPLHLAVRRTAASAYSDARTASVPSIACLPDATSCAKPSRYWYCVLSR